MKNSTHRIFLLSLVIIFSTVAYAQKKTITGFVTDSATNAPMANVEVRNLTANKKTLTDSKGKFSLQVNIDDALFFTKDNYHFQMMHYSLLMEQTLYVRMGVLSHELPGVTVQASYSKYQGDSIKRLDDFNKDLVSPKYKTIENNQSGAGAVINLDHFSKREKSKRQAQKQFEEHERDAYVRYRFSPELVSAYTGLQGDSLDHFINLYWPDYKWLRQHPTDEDVFYYINDKLKDYYKRKDEK